MARRIARLAESLQGSTDYPASFKVDPDEVTAALLVGGRRYQTGELLSLCRRSPITLPMGMIPTYPEFPLAPWESPGGTKAAFDPTADASLSISQGWDNFSQMFTADGAGALATSAINGLAAKGAGTRMQLGILHINTGSTTVNGEITIDSNVTGTDYIKLVNGNYDGWCGALVDDGEAVQITASGLSANSKIAVNGQYRVVLS